MQSLLLDDPVHLMYHVTMIADAPNLGLVCCSALSQSVDQPLGMVPASSVWAQWEKTQRGRVLETVVGDLMEEFVAKVGLARSQGPS